MTKNDDDWKARAQAAEAKIAAMMQEHFESTLRQITSDTTTPLRQKGAKLLRLFAELLDSDVPMAGLLPMLDRYGPIMQEAMSAKDVAPETSTP